MSWYPSRISTRLTIGGILLLAVTTAIIIVVMLWRGQPRVVEINTALIEETGRGLTSWSVQFYLRQTEKRSVWRAWRKCCPMMRRCTAISRPI